MKKDLNELNEGITGAKFVIQCFSVSFNQICEMLVLDSSMF